MCDFVHLHCHTQYSILDGASDIGLMMDKAVEDGQKGLALTDHGNMFGAFKFVSEANKRGLKPIVGCEFYMVKDRKIKSFSKVENGRDKRFHQLLLAKNRTGYENLSKLCSLGFTEGLYSKFPRIDKELILQFHEGIIATSCCLGAEIPQAILNGRLDEAEELIKWWLDLLGEDFYIELQRHRGLENIDRLGVSQEDINEQLIKFAKKYNIKVIATNDTHYVDEEDAEWHDILLCVNTGRLLSEKERFKFSSSDYFFKTQEEMKHLFKDVPQSISNTLEIYEKIEPLDLASEVLLPSFPIPEGFENQSKYLRHITYEGAKRRYGEINEEVRERIDFELKVIDNTGYPGYFLIVQDFTNVARELGVSVGPGRGSAAGSAVAYCTGITNVDPIKYELLFERFLNPDRISLPDIDIDFDDVGRQKVIDYVIDKYGKNQVAQIITYGTMAAKSSIRDVGRVMDIPLSDVDRVAKSFPHHLNASLAKVLAEGEIDKGLKQSMNKDDQERAHHFRKLSEQSTDIGRMIRTAKKIEGSIRNTGIHACGVIITPDEITKYVPVKAEKDSEMLVSQFDNSVAEDAGLLKMDFLGLKTLSIIKTAVGLIKSNQNIDLDIDEIPLDDELTYKLFQKGDTSAIFQYESSGMQRYMKELAPTEFDDLIAMNALYRPGPLEYIPNFIKRKNGKEKIQYDLPEQEEFLKNTYGITVYQEQVMLLSQKLADFTKGMADQLRKAMGKKQRKVLDKLYPKFVEGGMANNHPRKILDKIWKDWERFASYAFNKSHSTCYALIAFQTAYLKSHFPSEFMAAVLTHNKNDIKTLTKYLVETKRMNIRVLGPDVNKSQSEFSVDKQGNIRFGLSAIKGIGEGPVEEIILQRTEQGAFSTVFDFVKHVDLRTINKKCMESLVLSGAMDGFEEGSRAAFFAASGRYNSFLEHLTKFGAAYQSQIASAQNSLFGDNVDAGLVDPVIPDVEEWPLIEKLTKEKDVTGIFISGHPLDDYAVEIKNFTNCTLDNLPDYRGAKAKVAGIVTKATDHVSQKGNGYGKYIIQDFGGTYEFNLFTSTYQKFRHLLTEGSMLFITCKNEKNIHTDEYRFVLLDAIFLESAGSDLTESLTIQIPLNRLDDKLIQSIENLCVEKKGAHKLRFVILDKEDKISISTRSKQYKVLADNEFLNKLDELDIGFSIN